MASRRAGPEIKRTAPVVASTEVLEEGAVPRNGVDSLLGESRAILEPASDFALDSLPNPERDNVGLGWDRLARITKMGDSGGDPWVVRGDNEGESATRVGRHRPEEKRPALDAQTLGDRGWAVPEDTLALKKRGDVTGAGG